VIRRIPAERRSLLATLAGDPWVSGRTVIATALAPHDRRAHAGFVGLTGPAVAVNPNTARRDQS
jgi:hypothetical protein